MTEPAATPMPDQLDRRHFAALYLREQDLRVLAGEIEPFESLGRRHLERFNSVRVHYAEAWRACKAEGERRGRGGTWPVTMPQLVGMLAEHHPEWDMTGDEYCSRDNHHSQVRRHVKAWRRMGLVKSRVDEDDAGWERRTIYEFLDPPEVTEEELVRADAQLAEWERLSPGLIAGGQRAIPDARRVGDPLPAGERQRRAIKRARGRGTSRRRRAADAASEPVLAPPSGTPATPENTIVPSKRSEIREARKRTGVTRTSAPASSTVHAALNGLDKTSVEAEIVGGGEGDGVDLGAVEGPVGGCATARAPDWDPEALVARVKAREAERRPVLEAIAARAAERALEVHGWGLERSWPFSRLREAWVVARRGPTAAADAGPGPAGPLYPDDYARLRRAVARYERHQDARPEGYPEGGLGALLHIGALARVDELGRGPQTLRYAVGALDQLSRRMRALATADSAEHARRAAGRARRRREPPARTLQLTFRQASWPPWLLLGEDGQPTFDRLGMLQLDPHARYVPPAGSDAYRMVVRDAYLLAGRQLPVEVDGRTQMALRHQRQIPPATRRPTRTANERELAELAHRIGEPVGLLARLSPDYRRAWLVRLRTEEARRAQEDILAFKAQLRGEA